MRQDAHRPPATPGETPDRLLAVPADGDVVLWVCGYVHRADTLAPFTFSRRKYHP